MPIVASNLSAMTALQHFRRFLWQKPEHFIIPPIGSRHNLLMRLIIGGTTLAVSLSAYYSYQVVRNLLLDNLQENALLKVQQKAEEIDSWIKTDKATLQSIANTPTFQTMDWTTIEPYLRSQEQRLTNFAYFGMITTDGFLYTTLKDQPQGSINLKDRKHFQGAMAGKTSLSDPLIARIPLGARVVAYAVPVWSGVAAPDKPFGEVIGAMNGVISINRVTEVVNNLRYGKGSYAFALNSKAEAIVHPNQALMSTLEKPAPSFLSSSDQSLVTIAQHLQSREKGMELLTIDGQLQYVAYTPLRQANWSVALVIPRQNIESQLRPLDLIAAAIAGLAGMLIVVLWQVQAFEQSQLKKSKVAADAANQAKSEFLANMSHELRTPLNGILGYAQILSRATAWGEKEQRGIDIIHQCGSHLLMLINDVLDLSKIEARKMELYPRPFHFPSFLQGIVEINRIRAEQKGIAFHYLPDPELPEGIQSDEKRLRQVLLNLLGNAIKFTEQGAVTFTVTRAESNQSDSNQSSSNQSSIKLRFQIEDTGVGINPAQIQQIFLPFEQVGDQTQRAEGTGLGLAISSKIVSLMQSQIQVESQLGQGSRFFFEADLPLAIEWRKEITIAHGKRVTGYQGWQDTPRTILVADDKWENRSVLVNLLEPLNFTVVVAENGQEALAQAIALTPDLIISDLLMPVMDGYELLRQLRLPHSLPHIPVIASSASVSERDQQRSLDAGANAFLAKPVQIGELLQVLEQHLSIDWIYEAAAEPSLDLKSAGSVNPASLQKDSLPPQADLETLLAFARQGRLKKLVDEARRIEQLDNRYAAFTQQIMQLAKNFQAQHIEELLKTHLSDLNDLNE
jgi:signal transduction histidine kinase/DNA-binding NarL/FixJ family response regulator